MKLLTRHWLVFYIWLLALCLGLFIMVGSFVPQHEHIDVGQVGQPHPAKNIVRDKFISKYRNLLDGCKHVYLDVGTNVGIQIRKLYEPHLYPGSPLIDEFRKHFNSSDVCSVGFEPNPRHRKRLHRLVDAYNRCGYRVYVFTNAGVSDKFGTGSFYSDGNVPMLEWGGGILASNNNIKNKSSEATIDLIRLSTFISEIVAKRQLPSFEVSEKGRILVKMDIEGSEIEVVSDMLVTGAMQFLDTLFIEWHGGLSGSAVRRRKSEIMRKALNLISTLSSTFTIAEADDEMYGTSDFPLP